MEERLLNAPRRCLIIRLGAIGDIIMALPAAWKLHQDGWEIDWLCGKAVLPLLSCYRWVRPIMVDDQCLMGDNRAAAAREVLRTWRALMKSSYDLCAMLHYDRRYRVLTLPVRAKRRLAMDWNDRQLRAVSERPYATEYARILLGWKDERRAESLAPLAPDQLPKNLLPHQGQVRIALVPGGARNSIRDDPQRRWPIQSYVALAKLLLQRGYEVVLTGGPGDRWVEASFTGLPVNSCIGSWTIPETIAFYQSCDCVVTHDTGPLHLAGVTSCNLVALFGPTAASRFLPRRDAVLGLWGGERLPCRPCYDGRNYAPCATNECMASISPERVLDAVQDALQNPKRAWRVEHLGDTR